MRATLRRLLSDVMRLGLLLACVAAIGCADEPPPPPARGAPVASLAEGPTVEFAGCRHRQEQRCVLVANDDGTAELRVWVDIASSATLGVDLDGTAQDFEVQPADGGQHLRLRILAGATRLTLRGLDPTWPEPVSLELDWEVLPEVVGRARHRAQSAPGEAAEMLERALPSLAPRERLEALQLLRRVLAGTPRRAEIPRVAEDAAALARRLGRDRDLADIASALAFGAIRALSLTTAQRWIDEIQRLEPTVPEARVWAPYYEGLRTMATGDLTAATRHLADAERRAERLGMLEEQMGALEQHAIMLGELGRADEALAKVRRGSSLASQWDLPCPVRARTLGNLGWAQLRLVQQGFDADVPREEFEESLEAWERQCPDPGRALNQRINLALAAIVEGEFEEAHALYEQLRFDGVPKHLEPWVAEIGARVAVQSGRWARMPSVLLRPRASRELGLDWSVAVRRADLLASLGLGAAAIEVYAEAERMLDEAMATVGTTLGTELLLDRRSASARGLVRELVARGASGEALCRARIARRRALRTMDRAARIASLSGDSRARWETVAHDVLSTRAELQTLARSDWELSETQRARQAARRAERHREATAALGHAMQTLLTEPEETRCDTLPRWAPDERLLLVTAGDDRVLAFVADAEGDVTVATAPARLPPPTAVASALASLEGHLRRATRIRVMAEGLDQDLPLPNLPLGDGTLLDAAPMVHALDLGGRAPGPEGPRRALVIADPSENLPGARAEADAVEQALEGAGWEVQRRSGRGATREAVLDALGQAAFFHYAGHGIHRGRGGWDAALLLHEGELGVTDLLAVPRVPPAVVLAGCETGARTEGAWAGGINLGRAFVLAGAAEVLVADDTLDDRLARRVGEALAREVSAQSRPDLPRALQAVQQRLREDDPDGQWWRLRVLVP